MMPDYTNLSSLFGNQQAPSIMGGAMAGLRLPYEMQGADNTLQAQQIQNMSELEKLRQTKESDNPTKTAQNDLATSRARAENDPDLIKSAIQAELSGNEVKDINNQGQIQARQQLFAADLGQEIKQRAAANDGKPFDPLKESDVDWWKETRKKAAKLNVPFPEYPDYDINGQSKFLQMAVAKGASIYDNPELYAKLKLTAAEGSNRMAVAKEQSETQRYEADQRYKGTVYTANAGADSRVEVANVKAQVGQSNAALVNQIAADLRAGNKPSDGLVNMAANQMFITEADKTGLGIASLKSYAQGDKEAGDKLKQQWIENWKKTTFPTLYGGGSSGSNSSTPVATDDATFKAMKTANPTKTDKEIRDKIAEQTK